MKAEFRLLLVVLLSVLPKPAWAYPFMIGHGYTSCAQCHADPSGGGTLTEYGRGQAEIFMRSVYRKRAPDAEPGKIKDFAFGAVPLPKALQLQGDVRGLFIPQPSNPRFILMQADLRGHVQAGRFHVAGSAGYVSEGGDLAWLTSNATGGNMVSRDYWLGMDVSKWLLIRAGRLALPYGIRSEEHILFARSATRTDTNDGQTLGLDAVYGRRKVRLEGMGILGNTQIGPDAYRERGYSAVFSFAPKNTAEVGLSSLVTHADLDIDLKEERLRQAHGIFGRYAPVEDVRLLAEANVTVSTLGEADAETGSVGYVQLDAEPAQGFHLKATAEWCDDDHADADAATLRGTATALWFLAPHMDLRVDAFYGTLYCTPGVEPSPMGLMQLHMFL